MCSCVCDCVYRVPGLPEAFPSYAAARKRARAKSVFAEVTRDTSACGCENCFTPMDLREVVLQYAQELRDNYRCEPVRWVLNPWEYDTIAKAVEDGTAPPDVVRMFADCVRAER